jgi:transposase-like protein
MKETTGRRQVSSRIEYWREQVAQHGRSGQTVKQFCEAQGIAEQSFYVWRKRLQKQPAMRFALVETTAGERQLAGEAGLELILARGERLRISSGVDSALLRTVLELLRG